MTGRSIAAVATVALSLAGALAWPGGAGTAAVAGAASTAASSISKTGVDVTRATSADSDGHTGATHEGDTIDWVLHVRNTTTTSNRIDVNDVVGSGQVLAGSVQAPPGFSVTSPASGSGGTITASGISIPQSTGRGAGFSGVTSLAASQGAGDGWAPVFFGDNVYAVFHHAGGAVLLCRQRITGDACAGFPTGTDPAGVSTVAGTPLSSAGIDGVTAQQEGAVVSGSTLYFPMQLAPATPGRTNTVGLQCVDLAAYTSCGFVPFATDSLPLANNGDDNYAHLIGDGVPAANGHVYYGDMLGRLFCFDPAAGTVCGTTSNWSIVGTRGGVFPPPLFGGVAPRSVLATYGRYVFGAELYHPRLTGGDADAFSCFDTQTGANCPGFPLLSALPFPTAYFSWSVLPVLDATGAVTGACWNTSDTSLTWKSIGFRCYDLTATPIANPYPGPSQATWGYNGFLSPAVVGTRVYLADQANADAGGPNVATIFRCLDFASVVGGVVQPCAGFAPPSVAGSRTYAFRPDPQLPNCLWALGDAELFSPFDGGTGGACAAAGSSVSVTPSAFYCDGGGGHVTAWNAVTLGGITGNQFASADLTLTDATGAVVPGYDHLAFPASGAIDLGAIPVTGSTASLTAAVRLLGASDTAAAAAEVDLSFVGDPVQVCYATTVSSATCLLAGSSVKDAFTATSQLPNASPDVNTTPDAVFVLDAPTAACTAADLSVAKSVESITPIGGGRYRVVYDIAATNSGDLPGDYDLADHLALGAGIVVDSVAISGAPTGASTNPAFDGAANPGLISGRTLAGHSTETYRVTVVVTVPTSVTGSALDCGLGSGGESTALANDATLSSGGTSRSSRACGSVPQFHVTKRVTGVRPIGNGEYRVDYAVTVVNVGGAGGTYRLADRLRFGPGIGVVHAAVVGAPSGVVLSPGFDGRSHPVVTARAALPAGGIAVYHLRIIAAVPPIASPAALVCGSSAPRAALRNVAAVGFNGVSVSATACASVAQFEMDKQLTALARLGGRTYRATYRIHVANVGGASGTYGLADGLSYDAGLTVLSARITAAPPGVRTDPSFDGQSHPLIVLERRLVAGGRDTYEVTVVSRLRPGHRLPAADRTCGSVVGRAASAFLNEARITGEQPRSSGSCDRTSAVTVRKTVLVHHVDGGVVSVVYALRVTNASAVSRTYTLSDGLAWGSGLTVRSVDVGAPSGHTPDPSFDGISHTVVASGQVIGAHASQVWVVTVRGTLADDARATALDCATAGSESRTGTLNVATVRSGAGRSSSSACWPIPNDGLDTSNSGVPTIETGRPGNGAGPSGVLGGVLLTALGAAGLVTALRRRARGRVSRF